MEYNRNVCVWILKNYVFFLSRLNYFLGSSDMADSEDSFRLQNSPTDTDPKDLQNDGKSEKQNAASSKSPSSQTTYIQQVTSTV